MADDSSVVVMDVVMKYGLFFGAIFQLICILAIVVFPSENISQLEHEIGPEVGSTDDGNGARSQTKKTPHNNKKERGRKRR